MDGCVHGWVRCGGYGALSGWNRWSGWNGCMAEKETPHNLIETKFCIGLPFNLKFRSRFSRFLDGSPMVLRAP